MIDVNSTPAIKTIRVFVSSTFRDMQAERDHLIAVVFPELRERIEQLGFEFFDVDLRWGVPEQGIDGEKANSWEYCKKWIDQVEPLFVCILGQRYGWVPEAEHFKKETERKHQETTPRSITDLEVRHAVLDNQRKRRSYFYFRESLVPKLPEQPGLYNEYVDNAKLQKKLVSLKTEILKCGRPVYRYQCRWEKDHFIDFDEFGKRVLEDLWSGFLREERFIPKEIWWEVLGKDPDSYSCYTNESEPIPEDVWKLLVEKAKPVPKEPLEVEHEQMLAFATKRTRGFHGRLKEIRQLNEFIHSIGERETRLAVVTAVPGQGKSALLSQLHMNLTKTDSSEIYAISHFVGITSLSATAYQLVRRLLDEMDRGGIEWSDEKAKEGAEPKRDFDSLCQILAKRLSEYKGKRRIVILIDALNQLSDGHDLCWLPNRIGGNVRMIVSCVDDPSAKLGSPEQCVLQAIKNRTPVPIFVRLEQLLLRDVRTITTDYLKEYCHELDKQHMDTLCAIPQVRNPLYLLLMLNELRTLGGNDLNKIVPELISSMSVNYPDTVSLFKWTLQKLEVFGKQAVQWWCLYLLHGRNGMSSSELAHLLKDKLGKRAHKTALQIERGLRRYSLRRETQIDFFHSQLRQAVVEKYGALVDEIVVHKDIGKYFVDSARGSITGYEWETEANRGFSEAVYHHVRASQYDIAAKLLCCFTFLFNKIRLGQLEDVFKDYHLLLSEAPSGIVYAVEIWSNFFGEMAHILRRGNSDWSSNKIFLQLAVEHADDSPITSSAEQWLEKDKCDWHWFRRATRTPHVRKNPCVAVLEGHNAEISGVLPLPEHQLLTWSKSEDDPTMKIWDAGSGGLLKTLRHKRMIKQVMILPDGSLFSYSYGSEMRIWDSQSHECVRCLEKGDLSTDRFFLLDSERLASVGWKDVCIWNIETGSMAARLTGHTSSIRGMLLLSDGRILTRSEDYTIRIWDGTTYECLDVIKHHSFYVHGVYELTGGRIISWSGPDVLIWDMLTYECLAKLELKYWGTNKGVREIPGGRLFVWSDNPIMQVYNSITGKSLLLLQGHKMGISGTMIMPDGVLLSWSNDFTLRTWNLDTGKCLSVFDGHTNQIFGAKVLDSKRIYSWSADNTIRIWDVETGACLCVLSGHTRCIYGAQILDDGHLVSYSGDYTIRIWDISSQVLEEAIEPVRESMCNSYYLHKNRILTHSWSDGVKLWNSKTGLSLSHLTKENGSFLDVIGNNRYATYQSDNSICIYDSKAGELIRILVGHTSLVRGIACLKEDRLATWSEDCTLRIWDDGTDHPRHVLNDHGLYKGFNKNGKDPFIHDVLVLSDGRLVSRSSDDILRVWDPCQGILLANLGRVLYDSVDMMECQNTKLVSWSYNYVYGNGNSLRAWNLDNYEQQFVIYDTGSGSQLTEMSDQRFLLNDSMSEKFMILDVLDGGKILRFTGHSHRVLGINELSDGSVFSWSADKTIRIWNSHDATCKEIIIQSENSRKKHSDLFHLLAATKQKHQSFYLYEKFGNLENNTAVTLCHADFPNFLAIWNSVNDIRQTQLLAEGIVTVNLWSEEFLFLHLYHGNRSVTLADFTEINKI